MGAFTDSANRGVNQDVSLRGCARTIGFLLKTWHGLLYLCMNDYAAIKSLIGALSMPSEESRVFFTPILLI